MGGGKSLSAIRYMNYGEDNYIYLTPYLDEVDRIIKACDIKNFVQPEHRGSGKLDNLHQLLGAKRNISSTHALFSYYTEYTADLIREGDYVLILDEVFNVLEPMEIKKDDIDAMFKAGLAAMDEDGEHIKWLMPEYDGTKFRDVKEKAESHNLIFFNGLMLFWTFPIEIFKAFKEVIVLTYMFDAQVQRYYYDMYGIPFEYMGVNKYGDEYYFTDEWGTNYQPLFGINEKIHILDDEKLNKIGDSEYALSSTWFQREQDRKQKPLITSLKNNLFNVFHNRFKAGADEILWTAFKQQYSYLKGKGYANSFVSCNIRATNQYRDRRYLAYCINVFFNPVLKQYFSNHNVRIQEDEYALSELVQWCWRSAIRDGKEIWLYIPSRRMRDLLKKWINDVSGPCIHNYYIEEK